MTKESTEHIEDALHEIEIEAENETNDLIKKQNNSPETEQISESLPELDPVRVEKKRKQQSVLRRAKIKNEHLQEVATRQAERIQYLEQQAERYKAREKSTLAHKANVETEFAKAAMIQARESGDVEKEAEAIQFLGKIAANQSNASDYEDDDRRYEQEYAPVQYQPTQTEYEPALEDWLQENDWCDKDSDNYDPELAAEALAIDREFAKNLRLQGEGKLIGTKGYYDQISKHIRAKYGVNDNSYTETSQPTRQARSGHIAPVNIDSSGSPLIMRNSIGKQIVRLPERLQRMVMNMPMGDLSPKEKLELYARKYYAEQQKQRS